MSSTLFFKFLPSLPLFIFCQLHLHISCFLATNSFLVWRLTLNIKNGYILFSYLYLCKYYFPIGSRCVLELHLCLHGHYVISWPLKSEYTYWKYLINSVFLYYYIILLYILNTILLYIFCSSWKFNCYCFLFR